MPNILLITDIPRLRTVFDGLRNEEKTSLRMSGTLDGGIEEIASDKPSIIMVQTHLSGLSADIILKHIKNQLGRKRSKFVLLCDPANVSPEIIRQFHASVDVTLGDKELFQKARETIAAMAPKTSKNKLPSQEEPAPVNPAPPEAAPAAGAEVTDLVKLGQPSAPARDDRAGAGKNTDEGVTYKPRAAKVYSEFNTSLEVAVDAVEPKPVSTQDYAEYEVPEPGNAASPGTGGVALKTILLWAVPVMVVAVVVTIFQYRSSHKPDVTIRPESPGKPEAVSAKVPDKVPAKKPSPESAPEPKKDAPPPVAKIGEKKPAIEDQPRSHQARLKKVPDFVPRYAMDKSYGTANPGWERYMGHITEFKILRDSDKGIRAVQVIDHGGLGVPESFMRGAIRQMVKKPRFELDSREEQEGYTLYKGTLSEGVRVVYYRDKATGESKGTLRAFVVTWQ